MKAKNKLLIALTISSMVGRVMEKMIVKDNIGPNVQTTFNKEVDLPIIDASAYIHPQASVIGRVEIKENVFVGPFASIRGDEGLKIHIGSRSNIQDGVVLHGLKNYEFKSLITENAVFNNQTPYSIYIGEKVSLAPQSQIQGPVKIDNNVFIGMQAFVFDSYIEENVVLEPGSKIIGVTIPKGRYVKAGQVVTSQEEADKLPEVTLDYSYHNLNTKFVSVNMELAKGYKKGRS